MCRCIALLTIVLLTFKFCVPCFSNDAATRQHLTQAEPTLKSPKKQAEADAKANFKKVPWLAAGSIGCLMITAIGAYLGYQIGSAIDPNWESSGVLWGFPSDAQCTGSLIGGVVGVSVIPISGRMQPVSVPAAEHLLGKPPEYIEAYNEAYTQKIRSMRFNYTLYGGGLLAGGCLLLPMLASF